VCVDGNVSVQGVYLVVMNVNLLILMYGYAPIYL
jgi:hypothetical protein